MAHILWADDLILFSNTPEGLQKQMDGLFQFCSKNKMIVNETKTKAMIFGTGKPPKLTFNNKDIEFVDRYKYLGVIFNSISRVNGDVFREHAEYIKNKAYKAIYALGNKTKPMGKTDPQIAIYLFDCFIKPILTYGCDIWGYNERLNKSIEKVHLRYLKYVLGVKNTTSTLMVLGDTGRLPLSSETHTRIISNFQRLYNMHNERRVSEVFTSMSDLTYSGASTWIKSVTEIYNKYNCKYDVYYSQNTLKMIVRQSHVNEWSIAINDVSKNPGVKLYSTFKNCIKIEPYLCLSKYKHRRAIAKIRMSSHALEVEIGKYKNVKYADRLCKYCPLKTVENEYHFLLECTFYDKERSEFLKKLNAPADLSFDVLFFKLITSGNLSELKLLGKFIDTCFFKRSTP